MPAFVPLFRSLRPLSIVAVTVLAFTSVSVAFGQAVAAPTLSVAQLREDFDVFRKSLAEAHGGYDRYAPRAEIERAFDKQRARLTQPMSAQAFSGILAEAMATLRDGHARMEYDSITTAAMTAAHMLPLRVNIEGSRLVVMYNDLPTDTTIRPGMEIVRINGIVISTLLPKLLATIGGDGFIETGKRFRLSRSFAQYFWLYGDQRDAFEIVARDASGRAVTSTLSGILERDRSSNSNPVNTSVIQTMARIDGGTRPVILDYPGDSSIARLRIRTFDASRLPEQFDSVFALIQARNTKSLILDLRGNGGGIDEAGAALVGHLLNQPFRYFEYIHLTTIAPSFATWLPKTFDEMRAGTVPDPAGGFRVTEAKHSGVGIQQPSASPYTGKLVVLIDGGSFSTTADVAAQLRSTRRAQFVGEETAGGYEGNISGLNALIVLPNSKLRTKIEMYGYWNAVVPPKTKGRGTLPDYVVPRTTADVMNGVDAALNRAVELLRSSSSND